MPPLEKTCVDSLKTACERLGVGYTLWDEKTLRRAYPDEGLWLLADKLPPTVRRSVLLSDYFRMIVLNPGECYLDTDMLCHHTPAINFKGSSLLCMGEFWDRHKEGTGFIGVQDNFSKLDALKQAWREQTQNLDESCVDNLLAAYGPEFLRSTLQRLGIKSNILHSDQITHVQWKNKGALIHMGAGSWV